MAAERMDWQGMMDRLAAGERYDPTEEGEAPKWTEDPWATEDPAELATALHQQLRRGAEEALIGARRILDGLAYEVQEDAAFVYVRVEGAVVYMAGRAFGFDFECNALPVSVGAETGELMYNADVYHEDGEEEESNAVAPWIIDTLRRLNN